MKFKLGDRVRIVKDNIVNSNSGLVGTITAINKEADFIGVSLDNKIGRAWFIDEEIELDKNQIIYNIIQEL